MKELVPGPESVERHVAVGQQVLATLLGEPDRVRKDLERVHLGQILDRIEGPVLYEPIDETDRVLLEARPELLHGRGGEDAGRHRPGAGVQRWIGLQDEAGRPPRRLLPKIAQPDSR